MPVLEEEPTQKVSVLARILLEREPNTYELL